jgi:hypothetical protein
MMFFSRNFAHCALLVIYRSAIRFVDASDGIHRNMSRPAP